MVEIIDYVDKYADEINNLDEEYWGICETNKVSDAIKENDIVKIALIDDTVIAMTSDESRRILGIKKK